MKAMEEPEIWKCLHKLHGKPMCHCAQFDDGTCVPPWVYPEFSKRRNAERPKTGLFRKRESYSEILNREQSNEHSTR